MADRFMTEANWSKLERLTAFCAPRGRSLVDLAFAWLVSRPLVSSVIAGAMTPEQVDANLSFIVRQQQDAGAPFPSITEKSGWDFILELVRADEAHLPLGQGVSHPPLELLAR